MSNSSETTVRPVESVDLDQTTEAPAVVNSQKRNRVESMKIGVDKISWVSEQGKREKMQDSIVFAELDESRTVVVVADGYKVNGREVAMCLSGENNGKGIAHYLKARSGEDLDSWFKAAFEAVSRDVEGLGLDFDRGGGSTVSVLMIDRENRQLVVAQRGDSPIFVYRPSRGWEEVTDIAAHREEGSNRLNTGIQFVGRNGGGMVGGETRVKIFELGEDFGETLVVGGSDSILGGGGMAAASMAALDRFKNVMSGAGVRREDEVGELVGKLASEAGRTSGDNTTVYAVSLSPAKAHS